MIIKPMPAAPATPCAFHIDDAALLARVDAGRERRRRKILSIAKRVLFVIAMAPLTVITVYSTALLLLYIASGAAMLVYLAFVGVAWVATHPAAVTAVVAVIGGLPLFATMGKR